MKEQVSTSHAPAAIGPYSQAVRCDGWVFVSGQLPVNPATGEFAAADIAGQTRQVLENVRAVLTQAGCTLGDVVKATVFMQDLGGFAEMNQVYGTFFEQPFPARAAFQVAALPKGALVEIEVMACRGR